jgi:formylglycine-generating enzyme required for sulfatase activity
MSCRRSVAATRLMSCALAVLWISTLIGSNRMIQGAEGPKNERIQPPPGMVWIPEGEFTMGTDDVHSFPNERPAHKVHVAAFWIDEHDVTNAEFTKFVEATASTWPIPGRDNFQ